jgi:RNA-directed DNA polymerase
VNTDAPDEIALIRAKRRVLEIQTKMHHWANGDPHRRFDDLFNLVTDPAFLLVAWDRVRSNSGARTAGIDRKTVSYTGASGATANGAPPGSSSTPIRPRKPSRRSRSR